MNSLHKQNKTLKERGLPEHSFFHATFHDGSVAHESDYNWSEMSILKKVKYNDGIKTVMVAIHPIKHLKIQHGELETSIEIPEGHEVYQAVRATTSFSPNAGKTTNIVGRVIGLIKDGEVIEERVIDGQQNIVTGWRK